MRRAILLVSATAFLCGLAAADAMAATPTAGQPAASNGLAWCGFKDKQGSRVRCGYSSESDCKQAVGDPGAICIVDPYLTENRLDRIRRG
jgi:hypothetical protein